MNEEKKVKVVFEFDRKDYENYLFLIDQNTDKDTEKAWDAMVSEEVLLTEEMLSKQFGISRKEVLAMFVSMALLAVKDKV